MIVMPSGRLYSPLPIDNAAGFPQRFPFLLDGVRYQFTLYVNVPETELGPMDELMRLPDRRKRFLVVRTDILAADGSPQTVFLRKVVPSLEYRTNALALAFPTQVVARRSLNASGNFGTNIVGGVASLLTSSQGVPSK
jgi:hypothetical protein